MPDRLDLDILSALRMDGRISKARLAGLTGLSQTACAERIGRLEAAGYIRGYHADLDLERLGSLSQFIVLVGIKDRTPEKAGQFESIVRATPNIAACEAVSGSADYLLRIFARNVRHYHSTMEPFLVMEIDFTTYPVSKNVKDCLNLDLRNLLGCQI